MSFSRYAVYTTLPDGPLADFAASWLGWDVARGVACAHPEIAGLPMAVGEITRAPRKYGFHGTMKPPFRLAEGTDRAGLEAALAAFCAAQAPVTLAGLVPARLGGFLALVPMGEVAGLAALAARCVETFDGFRAPAGAAETARRRAAGLTPEQDRLLQRWGYPYVMEAFRYHMTLSGKLGAETADAVLAVLGAHLEPLLPRPHVIAHLTLAGERADGHFEEIHRYTLAG